MHNFYSFSMIYSFAVREAIAEQPSPIEVKSRGIVLAPMLLAH